MAQRGQTLPRMDEEQEQAPVREHGPSRSDLDALKDGAAMLSAAGNRVAALSLLWSAVAIDPLDLTAHRRLAATLATGGDIDGAADEFARYIDFVIPMGDLTRAMLELTYGVNMLGGHPAMHGVANKIADAVRALVPSATLPLAEITQSAAASEPTAVIAESALTESVASHDVVEPEPIIEFAPERVVIEITPEPVVVPALEALKPAPAHDDWVRPGDDWITSGPVVVDALEARREAEAIVMQAAAIEPIFIKPAASATPSAFVPRVVPKVPFRFCLHPGAEQHWMQLEGGTMQLVPDAVRVVDRFENVVEERLCMRMRAGDKGHSPVTESFDTPPLVWVVVSVPSQIVAAYEAGLTWAYTFQARVNGEWLACELVDSGCRLGRVRPLSAS